MRRIPPAAVAVFCVLAAPEAMFASGGSQQNPQSPEQARCSYPRPVVTDTKADVPFEYKGFVIDICGFADGEDRDVMVAALRRQIDLVEAMKLSPEAIAVMKTAKVWVPPPAHRVQANTTRLSVSKDGVVPIVNLGPTGVSASQPGWVLPEDAPILLHELMHVYGLVKLGGEGNVPQFAALFTQARERKLFAADSHMMETISEYFVQAAVIYLRGSGGREPFSRENIKNKQPELYQWLEKEFGPR